MQPYLHFNALDAEEALEETQTALTALAGVALHYGESGLADAYKVLALIMRRFTAKQLEEARAAVNGEAK